MDFLFHVQLRLVDLPLIEGAEREELVVLLGELLLNDGEFLLELSNELRPVIQDMAIRNLLSLILLEDGIGIPVLWQIQSLQKAVQRCLKG